MLMWAPRGLLDACATYRNLSKYALEGAVVAVVAVALPSNFQRPAVDVLMHALLTMLTFVTLDAFAPWMAQAARSGVGAGIGANLVGFPGRPRYYTDERITTTS
jgi:hypothetical protein